MTALIGLHYGHIWTALVVAFFLYIFFPRKEQS